MTDEPRELVRGLDLPASLAIVVGVVIGTGVFLKAAVITQLVGTPLLALAAWVVAGLLSLTGALTYAELGAMLPNTGGEYVFLGVAYGRVMAFQYGWMRIVIGASASAAVAASFGVFFSTLVPSAGPWATAHVSLFGHSGRWPFGEQQLAALAALAFLAGVNCIGVVAGGRTQMGLAVTKVVAVLVVIGGVFLAARTGSWSHFASAPAAAPPTTSAFGAAVIAAMWAYTGWSYLPLAAGEIRDPGRTLPRAIIGGIVIVILLYVGINVAYFYALPVADVASANSTRFPLAPAVATKAVSTFLSGSAGHLITAVFLLSALGTLNGSMLTTPRVSYAMARAGQFFRPFAMLGRRSRTPVVAIIANTIGAGILAATGTYDQLTDVVVFSYAIFYVFTTGALFILRRREPDRPRPYRTLGYPFVPAAFAVTSFWLVLTMVRTNPGEAWLAAALLALGVPVAWSVRRLNTSATAPQGSRDEQGAAAQD